MKIDLHVHSRERSYCCKSTEQEQIEAAISYGLDAIVFTDHNTLVPESHLKYLNEKYYPFKIFGGIEITTVPYNEDVLVIGVKDSLLQEKKWTYEQLYQFVSNRGGFIVLCHPYRYFYEVKIDINGYVPDAVEIHSTNIGNCDAAQIKVLAQSLNVKLLGNSDSHLSSHVGIYHNIINGKPNTEEELARVLKKGKIEIVGCRHRIDEFNKEIKKREDLIRELLEQGKNSYDYTTLTGEWPGHFDRVALGKSYEI